MTRQKKIIIFTLSLIFAYLLISPGMQSPQGRENVLEDYYSKTFYREERLDSACSILCDGMCIHPDSTWAPFGVLIRNCSQTGYYETFWGKTFKINNLNKLFFLKKSPILSEAEK